MYSNTINIYFLEAIYNNRIIIIVVGGRAAIQPKIRKRSKIIIEIRIKKPIVFTTLLKIEVISLNNVVDMNKESKNPSQSGISMIYATIIPNINGKVSNPVFILKMSFSIEVSQNPNEKPTIRRKYGKAPNSESAVVF